MIPLPPDLTLALRGPHKADARAKLTLLGQTHFLPMSSGKVTLDLGADTQRRAQVSFLPRDALNQSAPDPLALLSHPAARVTLERGTGILGGPMTWTPLGAYRVDELRHNRRDGTLEANLAGLCAALADDRLLAPREYGGPSALAALEALIRETLPDATVTLIGCDDRASGGGIAEESRLDACHDLATALGGALWETGDGRFEVRAPASPAWDATGATVNATATVTRADTYNAVKATGEAADSETPPPWAVAYDDNPDSPTRWDGPWGRKPLFYASPLLKDTGACAAAAATLLAKNTGLTSSLDLETVPHPGLEPGDVVTVDGAHHTLVTVTIGLAPGDTLTAATRVTRDTR